MTDDILLVTTPPSFGELIQQTLQETGRFRVVFVNNGKEAIQCANKTAFVLAILDAEVRDTPLSELINNLIINSPGMRFIVIPPNNHPGDPEVSSLPIQAYLMKPFYLPDFLETVNQVLKANPEKPVQQPEKVVEDNLRVSSKSVLIPPWLQDEGKIGQLLTSLSLESAAQGILIVRGEQLWAYAGQLNQPAAQEIARLVANYWTLSAGSFQGKKSDLARFVRLGSTGCEYMLFATPLRGEMVLALIFEAETPFNQIRTQAYQIARSLASPPGIIRERRGYKSSRPLELRSTPLPEPPPAFSQGREDWDEAAETMPLKPLLGNVPPPMPGLSKSRQTDLKELEQGLVSRDEFEQPDLGTRQVTEVEPAESFLSEGRQQSASPVVYDLNYFCLLIPRMPHHQLNGDLAEKLSEWVGQLCMAYGWRLEHISIHPEYMQWIINGVPTIPPAYMMDTLRQQSSERIFANFPELGRENPSGDFWAPGYLIMTRIELLSDQIIQDFIHQVRQYQGASTAYSPRLRR